MKKTYTFRLTDEVRAMLKKMSKKKGVTMGEFLSQLIINKNKKEAKDGNE